MFAPELGITEDPATGSAGGPLGAYLLRYGLVDARTAAHMVGEQGFEIMRPSLLHIAITGTAEQVTHVSVGGYTQAMGSGVLIIPD
jgi:trans-2,3-dihydro-3-hydroxyanthranilate isomerase